MPYAGRILTTTFALLFASGCFGSLDVGHDGQGGAAATGGTSTSSTGSASSGSGGSNGSGVGNGGAGPCGKVVELLNTQAPCFPQALTVDAQGLTSCVIIEATRTAGVCTCDPNMARSPVAPAHQDVVTAMKAFPIDATAQWNCFCEVDQVSGDCQTSAAPTSNGWCYVDANMGTAAASFVASCPATEKHGLRFVGTGAPAAGATFAIGCCE